MKLWHIKLADSYTKALTILFPSYCFILSERLEACCQYFPKCHTIPSGHHLKGDSESGDAHTWRGRRHIQLRGADVESQWVKPGEGSSGREQPATDTIHLINEQVSQNGNPTSDQVFLYVSNLQNSSTHTQTI